jgi:hypothetical protein
MDRSNWYNRTNRDDYRTNRLDRIDWRTGTKCNRANWYNRTHWSNRSVWAYWTYRDDWFYRDDRANRIYRTDWADWAYG